MTTPRKKYTPAFKAQIVQELLKEEQTLTQIASKHGVHPSQLRRWREAAVIAMPANFADEAQFQKHLAALTERLRFFSDNTPFLPALQGKLFLN